MSIQSKNSEIKDYTLCLGNHSKEFTINNITKAGLKGIIKYFSVGFNRIDTNDISDIYNYLIKRT